MVRAKHEIGMTSFLNCGIGPQNSILKRQKVWDRSLGPQKKKKKKKKKRCSSQFIIKFKYLSNFKNKYV
jgi:hypothetical protein